MKDYYYILGIESDASLEEIKATHRKLSKKFHPDLNPKDAHSEKMFKDIQEAYECLSNDFRRKQYDYEYAQWLNGKTFQQSKAAFEEENIRNQKLVELEKSKELIGKIQRGYLFFSILSIIVVSICIIFSGENYKPDSFLIAPAILIVLYLYFLPTIVAFNRGHNHKREIFIINIFCFIPAIFPFGWILLLIYSFNNVSAVNSLFLMLIGLFAQNQYNKHNHKS